MNQTLAQAILREAFEPQEIQKQRELILPVIEDLLTAESNGNLCIPYKKEFAPIFSLKRHPFFLQKGKDQDLVYFQKTHALKESFKASLLNRIEYSKTNKQVSEQEIKKAIEDLNDVLVLPFAFNPKQLEAVQNCCLNSFQIITGGPGTGKTTVIFYLLAVLEKLGILPNPEDIALLAPTGRAAQRMTESIQSAFSKFYKSATFAESLRGTTLQGLLKIHPQTGFSIYGKERFLTKQLFIVDEVSMVDLSLMELFFRALPPDAKVIFLGDVNQLPSVSKGEILRDMIDFLVLNKKKNLITTLIKSNRQSTESVLFNAAKDVIEGRDPIIESVKHWKVFQELKPKPDTIWFTPEEKLDPEVIVNKLWELVFFPQIKSLVDSLENDKLTEENLFNAFDSEINSVRVLSLFKQGPFGTDSLNSKTVEIAESLFEKEKWPYKFHSLSNKPYFEGMPLLILENDNNRKLFNGDTGIVLKKNNSQNTELEELRAYFKIDNTLKDFALDTLPPHSPAFFLTVHKSQGSEYKRVFFYLPSLSQGKSKDSEESNRLMNRRIFYTGMTRAKEGLVLFGDKEVWKLGISDPVLNEARLTGF